MAEIDRLDIKITGDADVANAALDDLIRKMGILANSLSAIGKAGGLNVLSGSVKEFTKELSSIGNAAKGIAGKVTPQIEDISARFNELSQKFQNLGKGFTFHGSTSAIQKQIESYSNALEKAKLKKEDLETSGKISGKAYEDAVKDVFKYENMLESLKNQLAETQTVQPQVNFTITGIEDAEKAAVEAVSKIYDIPESAMNYNADAMVAVFGEGADKIKNYADAVEMFGRNAGMVMNESTGLDTRVFGIEDAAQQMEVLSRQWQGMADVISQTFTDLKSGALWEYATNSVKDYMKSAQVAAGIKVYTDDYKTVLSDIERTNGALEKLNQKKRDMEAAGTDKESSEWQGVANKISAAESVLDRYTAKKYRMEGTGADVQFSGGLANESIIKTLAYTAGAAMSDLAHKIASIAGAIPQAIGKIPLIGHVAKEAAFIGQKAFDGLKFAISGIVSAAQKIVGAFSAVASGVMKMASGLNGAISKFASLAKSMAGIKGASNGTNTSLSGGFKTVLKYAFGIRSLYVLFNRLRRAATEAFKSLAQYSPETNAAISSLASSLGALKNSFAAAFSPILSVVAPYLSMFIDMLTNAMNTVGRFFSALTGQSFAVQSKKNLVDFAAGLEKTGSVAKKAKKDIKSYTLGIDELNIAQQENEDESGGAGGISPEDMFTDVQIESNVSSFADKVREAWANTDFAGVGQILGEKLKCALEGIPWEGIQEAAANMGQSFATLVNGFVEVDGLGYSIGSTIGQAINTGMAGINAFLDNTHWDSVGKFLGEGANGIVNTVDWVGLGHLFAAKWNAIFEVIGNFATTFDWTKFGTNLSTSINNFISDFNWTENGAHLGELIKGLLDSLIAFLEGTDWQALGNGVADFIGGIDWTGIMERLSEGIGAALGGIAAFLVGLLGDAWDSVVKWWYDAAFEDGKFTMGGLLKGIGEALASIGTWIVEHIFNPFISGFKEAFGIASPSTVFAEMGKYIIEGLKNGIVGAWEAMKESIGNVASGVIEKFKNVLGIHSPSKVMDENGVYLMEGLKNGISSSISGVYELFSPEKWTEIGTQMFNALMLTVETFKVLWTEQFTLWWEESVFPNFSEETWFVATDGMKLGILKKFDDFAKQWKINFKKWWDIEVVPFFSLKQWTQFGTNMKDGLYEGFKGIVMQMGGVMNGLVDVFNAGLRNIADAINSLVAQFNAIAARLGVATLPSVSAPTIAKVEIPKFEYGGFPEDGLFYANHNELVGSFTNGRTAVANNDMIVEGIAAGVRAAVKDAVAEVLAPYLSAIAQNTREAADKNPSLYIDGREMATTLEASNASMGFNFGTGRSRSLGFAF